MVKLALKPSLVTGTFVDFTSLRLLVKHVLPFRDSVLLGQVCVLRHLVAYFVRSCCKADHGSCTHMAE